MFYQIFNHWYGWVGSWVIACVGVAFLIYRYRVGIRKKRAMPRHRIIRKQESALVSSLPPQKTA